jgi:two-component system, NarL family, response regulator DevR
MHADPARSGPLRVVVIDADERVRESLAGLLCIGDQLCVVGSAGGIGPAIDMVLATEPDIVVLDPRLPEPEAGLTFIRRIRAVAPGVRILVMSGSDPSDQPDLVGSADGFVRKTFRPSDLVAAVIAAAVPLAG